MTSSKCVCLCVRAVVWKQIHKEDEREEMHKRQFWKDNVESRPVRDISGIPQLHVEEGFSLRETADAAKSHQTRTMEMNWLNANNKRKKTLKQEFGILAGTDIVWTDTSKQSQGWEKKGKEAILHWNGLLSVPLYIILAFPVHSGCRIFKED